MSRSWRVVKEGEYPVVEFTEQVSGVRCDHCGRIVPESFVDYVFKRRDGHHDGRDGKHAFCKDVHGLAGTGMVHKACRS